MNKIIVLLLSIFVLSCSDSDKNSAGGVAKGLLEKGQKALLANDLASFNNSYIELEKLCSEKSSLYSNSECKAYSRLKCQFEPFKLGVACRGQLSAADMKAKIQNYVTRQPAETDKYMSSLLQSMDAAYRADNMRAYFVATLGLYAACDRESMLYSKSACNKLEEDPTMICKYQPFSLVKESCDGPMSSQALATKVKAKARAQKLTKNDMAEMFVE